MDNGIVKVIQILTLHLHKFSILYTSVLNNQYIQENLKDMIPD